ncbi:MAG: nitroreductase family protein [Deltaproteobacteria bacterium]|nr:nitroreductase family protein [Deltaproteobacteria bacterium]MBW2049099.1 nitroreductase family protein [Deltaproteobacteria bacterium]MBW2111046.1 nitroreductase family protein [Deltaproteobacteria bacterium]MBW2354168.1 nitroreductase family protein [Deltaproteobacteria bacterium]
MSDLMSIIKERRSIRKYQDRDVPEETLKQILEAVQWSPSWANTQCWEVIVVKDPAVKEELQGTLIKNPATKAMVQAPVVLVLCGKLKSSGYYNGKVTTKFGDWFMFDLGIANQSLCLAAWDQGLGTVIVGLFDHDKARKILGVPEGYEVVSMIPMGYPAKDPQPPKRREINDFTHYDKF